MTTRLGRGAGPNGLNLTVLPFSERSDFDAAAMQPDSLVWQAVDVFTTHLGSWDVETQAAIREALASKAERRNENEKALAGGLFGIDQWARDAYLFAPSDPRYCDKGGADHSILICVQGTDGGRLAGAGVAFTSDGASYLQPPSDASKITMRSTEANGWTDIPIFASSVCHPPAQDGPWSVAKLSELGAADIVTGIGLPWNWHVSTFVVYQATRWDALQPAYASLDEALRGEAQAHQVMQLNPAASLQRRIFADGFTPTSAEFSLTWDSVPYVAQRAEHLATGVVRAYYCQVGHYDTVSFVAW